MAARATRQKSPRPKAAPIKPVRRKKNPPPKRTEPSRKTRTAARKSRNPKSLKVRSPKTENFWRACESCKQGKGRKQAHSRALACGLILTLSARAFCRRRLCLNPPAHGKHHLPFRHIGIHHHMIAMQHLAFQDLQRQRVLDQPLDRPLQRTRSIGPVIAFQEQQLLGWLRKFDGDLAVSQ